MGPLGIDGAKLVSEGMTADFGKRTGEFDARTLSSHEAMLVLQRAAALQQAALQGVSSRLTGKTALDAYTVRDLESAATDVGIPVRLVTRALAEVMPANVR